METVIIALAALIAGVLSGFGVCLLTYRCPKPPQARKGRKPRAKSGGGPGEGGEGP